MSVAEPARARRPDAFSIVDTTEVRWFFVGSLPPGIGEWFAGSSGAGEERCDTYLLDGRGDIGVKRRFGETLELKVRQSLDGRVELGQSLAGSLEVWRKWSPADGLVGDSTDGRWVDVHKSVVKRRFSVDGTEIALPWDEPPTGAGCDVEVAEVIVGAVRGWTFAFAAFGPFATRRDALLASWRTLVAATPCPENLVSRTARAMGYPEWLAAMVSDHAVVTAPQLKSGHLSLELPPPARCEPAEPAHLK